jgi:hypothetical protein
VEGVSLTMDINQLKNDYSAVVNALFSNFKADEVETILQSITEIILLRKNKIDERMYQVKCAENDFFWIIYCEDEKLNKYYADYDEVCGVWEKYLCKNTETSTKLNKLKQVGVIDSHTTTYSIASNIVNCEIEDIDGNIRPLCLEYRFSPDNTSFLGELLLDGDMIARCIDPIKDNRGDWNGAESDYEKIHSCPQGYSRAFFVMLAYKLDLMYDHIKIAKKCS